MDTRGFRSVPPKGLEYAIKKNTVVRRSLPACPSKMAKKMLKLAEGNTVAKALFFVRPVQLSPAYKPKVHLSYLHQIFAVSLGIGEGSFGVVHKVRSRDEDKLYAVKQMKPSHSIQYGYAEVRNYEKIGEHRNFVKFIMAWEEAKIVHIQMEYCKMSLAQYANIVRKVPEPQLWVILYDMVQALRHLHTRELVHLDVKPDNIMMSEGYYKLADFGLLVDLKQNKGRKNSTISDGDAKYLASEVLDGVYTYACDIFGLGISLLELATNIELPEFGPLWHQIRRKLFPLSFFDEMSRPFATTVERMMTMTHWKRPTTPVLMRCTQLRSQRRRDARQPRTDYAANMPELIAMYPRPRSFDNSNIVETPRRPLAEVELPATPGVAKTPATKAKPRRRRLARIKLDF